MMIKMIIVKVECIRWNYEFYSILKIKLIIVK